MYADSFFQLNLLPPYLLCSQGDENLIIASHSTQLNQFVGKGLVATPHFSQQHQRRIPCLRQTVSSHRKTQLRRVAKWTFRFGRKWIVSWIFESSDLQKKLWSRLAMQIRARVLPLRFSNLFYYCKLSGNTWVLRVQVCVQVLCFNGLLFT